MHRPPTRFALVLSALALGLALPALAEMRIEKTLKLSPGGEFRLDTDMGTSHPRRVGPDAGRPRRHHVAHKDLDELMTFRLDESPGLVIDHRAQEAQVRLVLELRQRGPVRGPRSARRPASPSRPPAAASTITGIQGEVKADTSGGGIGITNVAGDVFAETSGGGISLENIKGRVMADDLRRGRRREGDRGLDPRRELGRFDRARAGDGGHRRRHLGRRHHASSRRAAASRRTPRAAGSRPSFARGNSLGGCADDLRRRHRSADRSRSRPRDRGVRQRRQDGSAARGQVARSRAEVCRARSARAATRCASTRAEARSASRACRRRPRRGPRAGAGVESALDVSLRSRFSSACSRRERRSPATRYRPSWAATLIDGTGAPPVPRATVVVRDGKIECAGKDCKVPNGASSRT